MFWFFHGIVFYICWPTSDVASATLPHHNPPYPPSSYFPPLSAHPRPLLRAVEGPSVSNFARAGRVAAAAAVVSAQLHHIILRTLPRWNSAGSCGLKLLSAPTISTRAPRIHPPPPASRQAGTKRRRKHDSIWLQLGFCFFPLSFLPSLSLSLSS